MITKQITLKGWANCSDFLFSENSKNTTFLANYKKVAEKLESLGYKQLPIFSDLRGKNASEKVVIKGHYWRGSWASPTTEKYATFYK